MRGLTLAATLMMASPPATPSAAPQPPAPPPAAKDKPCEELKPVRPEIPSPAQRHNPGLF